MEKEKKKREKKEKKGVRLYFAVGTYYSTLLYSLLSISFLRNPRTETAKRTQMGIGMVFRRITSNRALWRVHMHSIAGVAIRGSCRREEGGQSHGPSLARDILSFSLSLSLSPAAGIHPFFAYLCNE